MLTKSVLFGHYPYIRENDIREIEWYVLADDAVHVLLVSKYGLNTRVFNEVCIETDWNHSSIKEWLNAEFMQEAFTEEEKEKIIYYEKANAKVFLLSAEEVAKYMPEDNDKICTSTPYAIDLGAPWEVCQWWLRTSGTSGMDRAVTVMEAGFTSCGGGPVIGARTATIFMQGRFVTTPELMIRPAIYMKKSDLV